VCLRPSALLRNDTRTLSRKRPYEPWLQQLDLHQLHRVARDRLYLKNREWGKKIGFVPQPTTPR
jgi:hypothetical protein